MVDILNLLVEKNAVQWNFAEVLLDQLWSRAFSLFYAWHRMYNLVQQQSEQTRRRTRSFGSAQAVCVANHCCSVGREGIQHLERSWTGPPLLYCSLFGRLTLFSKKLDIKFQMPLP